MIFFNNSEKYICRINNRQQFDKLLSLAVSSSFNLKRIIFEGGVQITNSELQHLISLLKNNPKAIKHFRELFILMEQQLSELPNLSTFKLTFLYISGCNLMTAPNFSELPYLETLYMMGCNVSSTPVLTNNIKLKEVDFSECPIVIAPDFTTNAALESLNFTGCSLTIAPIVEHCENLTRYVVRANDIMVAPNFKNNKKLKLLDLSKNNLKTIPDIEQCSELEFLNFSENHIRRITSRFPNSLIYLIAEENCLEQAPLVTNCKHLEMLWVENNRLVDASDLSKCPKIKHLSFRNNPLSLPSKVALMGYRPDKMIAYPFDITEEWVGDRCKDYKLLGKLYKSIPRAVTENFSFENYKAKYCGYIIEILELTARYQNWENTITRKILEYSIAPSMWAQNQIELLKISLNLNSQALLIISKLQQESDTNIQDEVIRQTKESKFSTLVQFKRATNNSSTSGNLTSSVDDGSNPITVKKPLFLRGLALLR